VRRLVVPAPDRVIEPGPVPSFSIFIPAYQAAAFIAEAVESALAQTVEAHEVIVCDDGSTDETVTALAPYRGQIVLLRRPHRGVNAAKNAAISAASGDFVVELDADDVFEPERLRALGELGAARPDLDLLGTDLYYEEASVRNGRFYEFTEFPLEHQRLRILETCFVACPALRRSRVLEIGGFDESLDIAGDWDLFIRLILEGSRVGIVDEPLMRYRKQAASITANRPRSLAARVTVLEKTRSHPGLTADERRFLEARLIRARSREVLNHAKVLTSSNAPSSRRSMLALAGTRGIAPSTRLALAAAAFTPVAATFPLLSWEERRVVRSRVRSADGIAARR
jgi:glycosyltransferase involved in cell wall biosynthesis